MQVALFSVLWGITVMHRCCGVYDLCFCQGLCAHVLLQSVCGVGGATRVRDRGERYAWTNPPCAPRCYYCCLLSPTLCWVDDIHSPSLRWSSCIWLLSNTVPSHCVGESLAVASIHNCAYCLSFSHSPFLFGGYCLDLTQTN
ncbi:retrotransposon hot spot (RHS) protein [Trypanosoma cruzi]|nr:retrotransposon hot spot (RHS) protein [Trypanosoma cruzi]